MQQQFKLQPSRYLAALFTFAHGVALALLYPPALPAWAKAALSACIVSSLGYHLWRDALLASKSSVRTLMLEGDRMVMTTHGGESITGAVLRDSLVTPFLTVLNIRLESVRIARSIVILPDSLDAESYRQLRVWLKWGVQPS